MEMELASIAFDQPCGLHLYVEVYHKTIYVFQNVYQYLNQMKTPIKIVDDSLYLMNWFFLIYVEVVLEMKLISWYVFYLLNLR